MTDGQRHALRLLDLLLADQTRGQRSMRGTTLLCRPEPLEEYRCMTDEEFCQGWAYRLGPHFVDALDIALDRRMRDKKPYYAWTQGTRFAFKVGHTLHRTDESGVVQVMEAKEASSARDGVTREPGSVRVQVYAPAAEPTIWEKTSVLNVTQDAFVRYLITGEGN